MKALLWEDDGSLLMYKQLDNGAFQWSRSESEAKLLTQEQFVWLPYDIVSQIRYT